MSKIMKGCVLVFFAFLAVGIYNYYSKPDTSGPVNYAELCRTLGRDPRDGPTCKDLTVYQLLLDEFPPGVATRGDVRELLGRYFLQSSERPIGGYSDNYAIQRVWFGLQPIAAFDYDDEGVLIYIGMSD